MEHHNDSNTQQAAKTDMELDRPRSLGRDGDCWKDLNVLPPQKRVSFAERHQVVLHISRKELAEERERIWYSKLNFGVFRNEAINEMRSYMRLHGIVSPDEALVCLYQPQPVIAAAVVGRVNSMS